MFPICEDSGLVVKGSGTLMTMLYKENTKTWDTSIWLLTFPFFRVKTLSSSKYTFGYDYSSIPIDFATSKTLIFEKSCQNFSTEEVKISHLYGHFSAESTLDPFKGLMHTPFSGNRQKFRSHLFHLYPVSVVA